MARAYTVATAAFALDAPAKWVDNILSHHEVPGVRRNRRGIRRGVPPETVLLLAVARILCAELGLSASRALAIAEVTLANGGAEQRLSRNLVLTIDLAAIAAELKARLDHAAEVTAVPRRGRRPARRVDVVD